MRHHIIDNKNEFGEKLRFFNGFLTYATATFIDDNHTKQKIKRLSTEWVGLEIAQQTTVILNTAIHKRAPDKNSDDEYDAIGSNHALVPFASSAMTRRNTQQLNIPIWGKYTINSMSYLSASGSAIIRVQEGGHSFADQLVSASIGNFIGLFIHDLFLLDDSVEIHPFISKKSTNINLAYQF